MKLKPELENELFDKAIIPEDIIKKINKLNIEINKKKKKNPKKIKKYEKITKLSDYYLEEYNSNITKLTKNLFNYDESMKLTNNIILKDIDSKFNINYDYFLKNFNFIIPEKNNTNLIEIMDDYISTSDLIKLSPDTFLNDTIINFYIKLLKHSSTINILKNKFSNNIFYDSFIFNTYFYNFKDCEEFISNLITQDNMDFKNNDILYEAYNNIINLFNKKSFKRIWKKNNVNNYGNIFIPINQNFHWTLLYINNLNIIVDNIINKLQNNNDDNSNNKSFDNITKSEYIDNVKKLPDNIKIEYDSNDNINNNIGNSNTFKSEIEISLNNKICIFYLDSIYKNTNIENNPKIILFKYIVIYLVLFHIEELNIKHNMDHKELFLFVNKYIYTSILQNIPYQTNSSDCGICVLEYIENIILNYTTFKDSVLLKNNEREDYVWFEEINFQHKRYKISKFIINLINNKNNKDYNFNYELENNIEELVNLNY